MVLKNTHIQRVPRYSVVIESQNFDYHFDFYFFCKKVYKIISVKQILLFYTLFFFYLNK